MSPSPQEPVVTQESREEARTAADGDKVVISGMAGLFPQARYVKDLENILYNKLNPVSAEDLRWKYNHPEVAQYAGNVPGLDCFDAQFFKVHYRLGISMDSMSRKILEATYEAIYDAGMSPEHLSGKKVGVYIGTCFSETEKACFYVATSRTGFGIAGCSKAMFANRISYWLNAKGPSVSIDEACCSSTAALEAAYKAMSYGECEAAIVGGANLCLHPQSSVHYGRIMNISKDGKTKSFSEDAAGCAKSEAINVLFLQKAKDAKRIYADVVYTKCEFVSIMEGETGPRYGFYRDPASTAKFLKTFYEEAGVPPTVVEYVEAFGSAIPEADKSELEAIDTIFCSNKEEPLLVGSVMSNIGYGEAASGISAITKVLLGFHNGSLAGNLHCESPRRDVAALREGRMRVLTDNQRFGRTYAAVNSMSVTGVNAHVLLHGNYKPKDPERYKASIPRLVTISGRQDTAVARVIDHLKAHPIDPEELALLHNIHETNIAGHLGKGYTILSSNTEGETVSLAQQAEYCDGAQRPLWFVYSGMGSQWAGMGAQLMRIPIFANAIERCRKVLEPKGIDIVEIITSRNKEIFDNILHSFVGIAAVQIGLTDILLELGLVPDKIIGHSVGELGCAYADGCLTVEEMILAAYSRGRVSLETSLIRGSMAAVGLGAQQIKPFLPADIDVACHNSATSCTVSGPADAMRAFVTDITARSIFAKEVPCSNIAYHSRYIAQAGPGLMKYLKEVIQTPRARSERWVSSSVPEDKWSEPAAKYSSAEYHTNNLLSPVLFEEASALIPADAVLVEVAPHGLLQAILKRALPSAAHVPLTRRSHNDSVLMLLDAVGKLYLHGYNPKVRVLYPKVEFPVSTGTPFLSHYVEWAHQDKWPLPLYQSARRTMAASCTFVMSIHDDDYKYFEGHVIRNKTLVPFSYVLVAAWDTLAMSLNLPRKSINVEFREVKLYAQPILHEQKIVKLSVSLLRGNGRFEVLDGQSKVATGFVAHIEAPEISAITNSNSTSNSDVLDAQEVYHLLYERGYAYSGAFRSIHSTDESMSEAKVLWNDNWVTLIDSLFQLNTLKYTHSGVSQPDRIGRLVIDLKNHFNSIPVTRDIENNIIPPLVDAQSSEVQSRTRCGGLVIENLSFRDVFQMNEDKVNLQTLKFVPRFNSNYDAFTALYVLLQIAAENMNRYSINILGITLDNSTNNLLNNMKKIVETGIPKIKIQYRQISIENARKDSEREFQDVDVILIQNLSTYENLSQSFYDMLQPNTFILNVEDVTKTSKTSTSKFYKIVSVIKNTNTLLELAYWKPTVPISTTATCTVQSDLDLPVLKHVRDNLSSHNGLLIFTSYPPIDGLIRLVKKWRKRETRNNTRVIMFRENSEQDDYSGKIPDIILANNILDNGLWGGEYFLPMGEIAGVDNNVTLRSEVIGDLNSLKWTEAPRLTEPGTLVNVHYAGINMGDVKRALGLTSYRFRNNDYGLEYSGITERGERVMGLASSGAAKSHVMAQPELTWPVPAHWSLEDAATVPFAYVYAYYCLVIKPAVRVLTKHVKQFSVLVHGGAGALGQATISIALARGWRVFTTVGDCDKKRFLMRLFPQLNEKDIASSRDPSFGDIVLNATNGIGCNVVVCCLKGELKNVSLNCCGPSSTVLDTVQILNNENYTFGMYNLTNERSYVAVDITSVFNNTRSEEMQKLHLLVSEGIACGEVRPLSRVTFAPDEAARAFRLLAASRHRGRALLRLKDRLAPPSSRVAPEVAPCHILICGSNSLELQLAENIISWGAQKLYLHYNAPTNPCLNYKLRVWKKQNVEVAVSSGNLSNINDVHNMLNSAIELGLIEGLYVIVDNPLQEEFIKILDLATRSACSTLKHFIVLSEDIHSAHYTCVQRAKNGLPATLLDISMLKTLQDTHARSWHRGATAAVQHALRCTDPILLALPETKPHRSLLQQIAALTDINICDKTANTTSLEDLGMSSEKSSIVSKLLRDMYQYSLDEEDIPQLSIERINQIENMSRITPLPEVTGLGTFFSYVDPDELLATTELVLLPTLTHNYNMRDDEFDMTESYLCIVPGLEGHHARFRALCERLKLPAFVLQPGLDHPDETPAEQALRYSKVLLKKTSTQKTFCILGYEAGVMVALELAAILEDHGLTGMVFCLGEGPEEMAALLEHQLSSFSTADELQEAVTRHMFGFMARGSAADVERALHGRSTWSERVDACVRSLLGHVPHSAQYARSLIEAAYARIEASRRADTTVRVLRSRLVLLRACPDSDQLLDACSLQRYSQQTIDVRNVANSIAHIAADSRVPAIVNSYLENEILQAFEQKNLCDTYLMNADAFMTSTKWFSA